MRSFAYFSADTAKSAIAASTAETQFLAGGTTLIDLMKLEVMQPQRLIDINPLHARYGRVESTAEGLRLGALVRMAEAARQRRYWQNRGDLRAGGGPRREPARHQWHR